MDKNNNVKNNLKFICIFFVTLFISFICIAKSFETPKENKKMLYACNIVKNADYKVYLKENDYISDEYIGMNSTYITDMVDYIDANFKYNYSISKSATAKSTYKVVAILNVEYSPTGSTERPKLWSKEYVLVEPKLITSDNNQININENVKIDFKKYNNEVIEFKQKYGLPIRAYMDVKLDVSSEMNIDNNRYKEQDSSIINLNMDLNQQVFNIECNCDKPVSLNRYEEQGKENSIKYILMGIGIVLAIVSTVGLLNIVRKIAAGNKKNDYEIALNRILKNYGDIVAEVVTPTETTGMKVIDVKNFDQLLDIEEEIRMPILFYEIVKGEEGVFTIYYDNIVYRYTLSGKSII